MTPPNETLSCPIHDEVEGLGMSEGPLSECFPWALLCEECHPHHDVIVGWETPNHGILRNWERFPREAFIDSDEDDE